MTAWSIKAEGLNVKRAKPTSQKLKNKTGEKECSWNYDRIKGVTFVGKSDNLECSIDH
jgi:hypothetical protein